MERRLIRAYNYTQAEKQIEAINHSLKALNNFSLMIVEWDLVDPDKVFNISSGLCELMEEQVRVLDAIVGKLHDDEVKENFSEGFDYEVMP